MRLRSLCRTRGAATALLAVCGVSVVASGSAASATAAPVGAAAAASVAQLAAVKSTLAVAMSTRETILIPHRAVRDSGPLTATELRRQIGAGSAALNHFFTPAAAAHEMIGLRSAASAEASGGTQILGGGVSNVTYRDVSVAGSTAHVHADVTTWLHFNVRQSATSPWLDSRPSGVLDTRAVLTKDSAGRWRVSSLDWNFASGSGP